MEKHFTLTNQEFENQFRELRLDPSWFSHTAHLRLSWIHITNYGLAQAEENICTQIFNFVKHVGAEDKFHKTVTVAAIKAVNHFIEKSQSRDFSSFINEFPMLKDNLIELLGSHYNYNIFTSEEAKKNYLEPDVQGF